MNVKQTRKNNYPSKLEVLEVLMNRSAYPNQKYLNELNRLRAGIEGEKVFVDYIEKFGSNHWRLIPNFWVEFFGTLECDSLLLTRSDLYLVEIKNYSGCFSYNNGISKLNDREISANAIYQTRKATMKIRELINKKYPDITVHGVLVFIGVDSEITITPEVDDITILQRHELRGFIEVIKENEKNQQNRPIDIQQVIAYLESYETTNPYPVKPLSTNTLEHLQKGVLCANCGNPNLWITRKFVKCNCGRIELRDQAMVRTIYEYGVLNFEKNFTAKEIANFLGNQAHITYIRKILMTHFELVSGGRDAEYRNFPYGVTNSYKQNYTS